MSIDISKFAKLLHEYVDTYVKYKDADNTEKIRLWLLLSDEAKELFLYFSKLQKDNDALKRRIETLQIYADDYWERLKAHRKITRSLNARIDELEALVNVSEGLYERIYEQAARIAELEEKQRWRVVADGELPEVYRDEDGEFIPFLVCENDKGCPYRALYDGLNWGDGMFVADVTHWMPLPEPPIMYGKALEAE